MTQSRYTFTCTGCQKPLVCRAVGTFDDGLVASSIEPCVTCADRDGTITKHLQEIVCLINQSKGGSE